MTMSPAFNVTSVDGTPWQTTSLTLMHDECLYPLYPKVAAVAPLSAMKSRTIASNAAVVTPGWMCGSTWARVRAARAPVARIPS